MKELNRFREFLAEGEIKEYYGPDIKFRPVTQNDWPLKEFGFETTIYDLDSQEEEDIRVMFDTAGDFDSEKEARVHFNKLFDPSQEDMWYEFVEREAQEVGIRDFEYDNIRPVAFAN